MSDQDRPVLRITSPSGETPTLESIQAQAEAQGIEVPDNTVVLDVHEMRLIMAHAAVSKAVEDRLTEDQQADVASIKKQLYSLTESDAGRVAYQLFSIEFDNTQPPYGDTFEKLPKLTWEEALERWKAGK